MRQSSHVCARAGEAVHQFASNRIRNKDKNDWNCFGGVSQGKRRYGPAANQDVDIQRYKFGRHVLEAFGNFIRKSMLYDDVALFDVSELSETVSQDPEIRLLFVGVSGVPENSNALDTAPALWPRRERVSDCCRANKRDELAPPHVPPRPGPRKVGQRLTRSG